MGGMYGNDGMYGSSGGGSVPDAFTPPDGTWNVTGIVAPSADKTYDLGTSALRWLTTYTKFVVLSGSTADYGNAITFKSDHSAYVAFHTAADSNGAMFGISKVTDKLVTGDVTGECVVGAQNNAALVLASINTARWRVNASGHIVAHVDATYDIGTAGAIRPRALYLSGAANVGGDLVHTGTNVGFYSTAATARPAAYTQTYSTATRTHAALTTVTVTSAFGTANGAMADPTATWNATAQGIVNDNFKECTTMMAQLVADLTNLKGVVNSLIDDHQILGLAT